jgi:hypothetical protein
VGAAALMASHGGTETGVRNVFRVYPLDPLPATRMDLIAWFILGMLGVVVQLAVTAPGKE